MEGLVDDSGGFGGFGGGFGDGDFGGVDNDFGGVGGACADAFIK